MKLKSLHFVVFLLLFSTSLFSQPVDLSKYTNPVKVACIGNSITYGSGIDNRPLNSYPAQLQRMLGENWIVRNFGVGGRTLLKKGDNPYWKEEAYSQAKAFLPDVVVIKLGTNDSKPQNWKFSSEFYTDYLAMVTELKNLPSHPRIYLCKPVPAYGNRWGINDSIIVHGVIPIIEKIAKKERLPVIELYSALSGKSDLFPDQIHPNADGAGLMAKTIYKALTGNEGTLIQAQYPGKPQDWHGFSKYDFQIDRRNARIVFPDKAAPGKPWVWRARFPDWHYQMDSILIRKGFHVVYIDTDELLGSPGCVEIWNNFYNYLITQYGLNKKVALEGVSRGGLYVFNFAKKYPERVACIYTEAPVCDFKSWPGGKGAGKGDADSWKLLQKAYNFKTEQEAVDYKDNPIDNLEKLAAAKVPLLFQIGLHDSIVPPEENTFFLANKYIRLGGPAMIYPNTLGKQSLQGHHFPIDDVNRSADFILNSYPKENPKLDSRNYHTLRNKLHNAQIVFEREKKGRVAFLGGSITYNGGWRDSICAYLQKRFPETKFDFIAAGIPSLGSTPGAFRFERDVLKNGKVDLLFEVAAVNDRVNGFGPETQILGMEGIVRHAHESNPAMDLVIMHFVDPDKMTEYRKGITPPEIVNHEKVAAHYGVSTINLAKEVTERIDNGEFTWENDFKNLHPSPFGQHVYYQSMKALLESCWSGFVADDDKLTTYPLPAKLNNASYCNGILIPAVNTKLAKGWQANSNWEPGDKTGTRDDFTKVPMLVTETPGETLKYDFNGNAIGIAIASGSDAGIIEYRIDKGDWKKQDLFTQWSSQLHLPWFITLGYGLEDGDHHLEIRVSPEKNAQSKGTACRIRYFYVNK